MKTKFLLLALAAMMVLPISATKPTDLKYPNGVKIPMKKVPTISIGYAPEVIPYSLDGLFDYDVVLSEKVLFIVVNTVVETMRVRIDCAGETVYEASESTLGGEMIEILLNDWHPGTYTLYLQSKDHIFKGEFVL